MARTITQIQNEIITKKNTYSSLSELNSTSNVSIWRLWTYIVASAIYTHEILWDLYKKELQTISRRATVGTEQWFVGKALEFQYDSGTPQVLSVDDDYVISYETEDESLRIITQAAVSTLSDNTIKIKLAKGDVSSLVPLDSNELSAAHSYFSKLRLAGQKIDVISVLPDKLLVDVDIYYDGQYVESLVQEDIIEAIETHLVNLEFDGTVLTQKVIDVIQDVDGVVDVVLNQISGRANSDSFSERTIFIKEYLPDAGYMILEDETGFLPEDTIKMYVV